jgi:hypothetical protein
VLGRAGGGREANISKQLALKTDAPTPAVGRRLGMIEPRPGL